MIVTATFGMYLVMFDDPSWVQGERAPRLAYRGKLLRPGSSVPGDDPFDPTSAVLLLQLSNDQPRDMDGLWYEVWSDINIRSAILAQVIESGGDELNVLENSALFNRIKMNATVFPERQTERMSDSIVGHLKLTTFSINGLLSTFKLSVIRGYRRGVQVSLPYEEPLLGGRWYSEIYGDANRPPLLVCVEQLDEFGKEQPMSEATYQRLVDYKDVIIGRFQKELDAPPSLWQFLRGDRYQVDGPCLLGEFQTLEWAGYLTIARPAPSQRSGNRIS